MGGGGSVMVAGPGSLTRWNHSLAGAPCISHSVVPSGSLYFSLDANACTASISGMAALNTPLGMPMVPRMVGGFVSAITRRMTAYGFCEPTALVTRGGVMMMYSPSVTSRYWHC